MLSKIEIGKVSKNFLPMFHFSARGYAPLNYEIFKKETLNSEKQEFQIKEERSKGIIQNNGDGHFQDYKGAPGIKDKQFRMEQQDQETSTLKTFILMNFVAVPGFLTYEAKVGCAPSKQENK